MLFTKKSIVTLLYKGKIDLQKVTELKIMVRGLRDGSGIEITTYCYRRPEFCSQHPHGGSQPFVTPAPRDPNLLSTRHNIQCTYTHAGKIPIHIKQIQFVFKIPGNKAILVQ